MPLSARLPRAPVSTSLLAALPAQPCTATPRPSAWWLFTGGVRPSRPPSDGADLHPVCVPLVAVPTLSQAAGHPCAPGPAQSSSRKPPR